MPDAAASAILTDLYQLTMAAGYFDAGKSQDRATFEMLIRRLPPQRNFVLAAGLAQAVDYLLHLRFTGQEIDYLRGLPQFAHVNPAFFEMLAGLRFTGDLFAVPEGTPLFPGEPFLTLRAPIIEAQIPETYLLATVGFQSLIATKAARLVKAAGGRSVVEFGTRRAHSPESGTLGARAAYIGGCAGTSNLETGFRYGIPVFGTASHSWVMSFANERESYVELQKLLGDQTVYLVDTYDTLEGTRLAASLGQPIWGVRLDSGNLEQLSFRVRQILDRAGLTDAKIFATGDLNEHKIHELRAAHTPIDSFGVGTDLATSADAPAIGMIYKMVEIESAGEKRFTTKLSEDKQTLPGAKQIFRLHDRDVVGLATECFSCHSPDVEALQRPVILGGKLVEPLPTATAARERAAAALAKLPASCHSLFEAKDPWPVELSPELTKLDRRVKQEIIS
jgi:nicotinate phosphoribosyltransferase